MRTGIANLPLHYGAAPKWLFQRMVKLAREITTAIVLEFGPEDFLTKVAQPAWFQAFGSVLGFDWHSSGLTTTTLGALKEGIKDRERSLGLFVAGGKGKTSTKTPQEIERKAPGSQNLVYASKMSAKVDNTAVQDGFQLYHHNFIFTSTGSWAVIQQGMNPKIRGARRYHWLSDNLKDFVEEPHLAICSEKRTKTLDLTSKKSRSTRDTSVELVTASFNTLTKDLKKLEVLELPSHHPVYLENFNAKRLEKILKFAYSQNPENFEKLLGVKGVGPKTILALALIAELIYGTKSSWSDPARFSFAHGGKDGHPYPVRRKTYNQSIEILRRAIEKGKVSREEKQTALARLKPFLGLPSHLSRFNSSFG